MQPPLGEEGVRLPIASIRRVSEAQRLPASLALKRPGLSASGGPVGWGHNHARSEVMTALETAVVMTVGVVLLLAMRRQLERVVLYEYQRGVLYRRGRRIR